MKILLKVGGLYHLLCAVTHIFFPKIFQWSERIESLSAQDSSVILSNLNVMNWCLFIFWLILAYIPFFNTEELINTKIGKTLLTSIVLFWIIRIFIFQPVFVGFDYEGSIGQTLFLMIGLVLFSVPWVKTVFLSK